MSTEKASEVLEKLGPKGKETGMSTLEKMFVVIMRAAVCALRIGVRRA